MHRPHKANALCYEQTSPLERRNKRCIFHRELKIHDLIITLFLHFPKNQRFWEPYKCTPSGKHKQRFSLLVLGLSILHYFSVFPMMSCSEMILFCYSSL